MSRRHEHDARIPDAVVAARRPPADHLAGAVVATAPRPAARLRARTLARARRRLHRCRPPARRGRRTLARALPWSGEQLDEPLCRGLRAGGAQPRLALRRAAFPRLLGRAEPGATLLSLGRLR